MAAILLALATVALRGFVGTRGLDPQTCQIKSEFDFGFEQGHIAGNLARGSGYSVKFGDPAPIPTAWASPAYPLLLAGVFRVWGLFTFESAIAVIWLNAIFHGVIVALLYALGVRIGSEPGCPQPGRAATRGNRVGLLAVALFLIMPTGWQFLHWAWCIHLLAALILLHLLVLKAEFRSFALQAALAGATLALAMLADGAAVMLMPISLWVMGSKGNNSHSGLTRRFLTFTFAWLLVLSPWMIRNGVVLGSWSPLRGMLGTALWMGNHPATPEENYHGLHENPWHSPEAAKRFIALGERGFDADCKARFFAELQQHPQRFVKSCLMRFSGFWVGEWWLGWRGYPAAYSAGTILSTLLMLVGARKVLRGRIRAGPLLAVLLLFPLSYYATFLSFGRYRFPIEPIMHLLAAAGIAGTKARGDSLRFYDFEPV